MSTTGSLAALPVIVGTPVLGQDAPPLVVRHGRHPDADASPAAGGLFRPAYHALDSVRERAAAQHARAATVALDPTFLQTIEGDCVVHLMPYGRASLHVASIARGRSVVMVLRGSTNARFAWHLSAARRGCCGVGMAPAQGGAR